MMIAVIQVARMIALAIAKVDVITVVVDIAIRLVL